MGESTGEALYLFSKNNYPRKRPGGLYDRIVCMACEKRFQLVDEYAYKFFAEVLPSVPIAKIPEETIQSLKLTEILPANASNVGNQTIDNYDYQLLKLFFISLLWRASKSNQDPFKKVLLGPFEDKAQRLIGNMDPGSPQDFPFFLSTFNESEAGKVSFEPMAHKLFGLNCYVFLLAGVCINIVVDSRPIPTNLVKWCPTPGRPLQIPHHQWELSFPYRALMTGVEKAADFKI